MDAKSLRNIGRKVGSSLTKNSAASVVLISAPSALRMGLALTIRSAPNLYLAATADDMPSALEVVGALSPDILVWVNESAENPPYWAKDWPMVQLGLGKGDLFLSALPNEIVSAIEQKFAPISARPRPKNLVTEIELIAPNERPIPPPKQQILSNKQTKILSLLIKGMTNQEIANIVGLSLPTARYHVSAIFDKLGASNRAEAIGIALSSDMIADPQ